MSVQTLTFTAGSTEIFEASNNASLDEVLLTNFDHDGSPNFTIETEQKLVGNGTYVKAIYAGERDIEIGIHLMEGGYTLRAAIETAQMDQEVITLDWAREDDPVVEKTYEGYISSFTYVETNGHSEITIFVKCPEPYAA